jgi:hypothetical protein
MRKQINDLLDAIGDAAGRAAEPASIEAGDDDDRRTQIATSGPTKPCSYLSQLPGVHTMNYLTRQVPLANWMMGMAKGGFISFGIIVGALYPAFWVPFIWPLAVVCVVTLGWTTLLWCKGIRNDHHDESSLTTYPR